METFSALLALCEGNPPVTGGFPSQRPVTRSFDIFFDLRLNKRLSKQSICRWFETPSRSLWRHCNDRAYVPITRKRIVNGMDSRDKDVWMFLLCPVLPYWWGISGTFDIHITNIGMHHICMQWHAGTILRQWRLLDKHDVSLHEKALRITGPFVGRIHRSPVVSPTKYQ